MREIVLDVPTPDAMERVGEALAAQLSVGDIVMLEGGLGTGKTTLTRGLLRGLGYQGHAPSPTFAILQGYEPPEVRLPIGHVDLYRIEDAGELEELGLDDWLANGALVVEWPDRLGALYANSALSISLSPTAAGGRLLTAALPKSWEERWPAL